MSPIKLGKIYQYYVGLSETGLEFIKQGLKFKHGEKIPILISWLSKK